MTTLRRPARFDPPDPSAIVSVIVTTMNRYESCRRCIQGVLSQDYSHLDIIVVEDGSSSGIEGFINQAALPNVRYVKQAVRGGLSAARNVGVKLATGSFVAFVDDDDVWKPNRISRQMTWWSGLDRREATNIAMIYCGAEVRDPRENVIAILVPTNRGELRRSILESGMRTIPSTYLFQRAALEQIGGFDEGMPSSVDHDIWMAMARAGFAVDFVPEPLVITYDRTGRDTMMSRTRERITGVSIFVSKWRETWQDWYGAGGDRYADEYFSRVISALAADHAAQGRYGEAGRAAAEVLRRTRYPVATSWKLALNVARGVARGLRARLRVLAGRAIT